MAIIISRIMMLLVIGLVSLALFALVSRNDGELSDKASSIKVLLGAALFCAVVVLFFAPDPGAVLTLQDGGLLMSAVYWLFVGAGALLVSVGLYDRIIHSGEPTTASLTVRPGVRRVEFDYIDQESNLTTREVTARSCRDGKITAYCHLRRAERSFFVDSIVGDVTDVETGEILDKRAWARSL